MPRKQNVYGGGAKTTETGLAFERSTDILTKLGQLSYLVIKQKNQVYFEGRRVASVYEKHRFYKDFLNKKGVDANKVLSKKLLPDSALVNYKLKKIFIIEKKFQQTPGSVDEKLQTCDFKLKQYTRLLKGTDFEAGFIFLLNGWFKRKEYRDVKQYICDVGCSYNFEELPLSSIGLDKNSLT